MMITEVPEPPIAMFADCIDENATELNGDERSKYNHKYSLERSGEALYKPHISAADHSSTEEFKHHFINHSERIESASGKRAAVRRKTMKKNAKALELLALERSTEQILKNRREWALENRDKSVKEQISDVIGPLNFPDGFFMPDENDSDASDINSKLNGFPGGLTMTASESRKYFGTEARLQFFERQHWIARKRAISTTNLESPVTNVHQDPLQLGDSASANNYAFCPARMDIPVKLSTKVIIRTQTLLEGDSCESQMKLIAKHMDTSLSSKASLATSISPMDSARSSLTGGDILHTSTSLPTVIDYSSSSPKLPTLAASRGGSIAKSTTSSTKPPRPLLFDHNSSAHKIPKSVHLEPIAAHKSGHNSITPTSAQKISPKTSLADILHSNAHPKTTDTPTNSKLPTKPQTKAEKAAIASHLSLQISPDLTTSKESLDSVKNDVDSARTNGLDFDNNQTSNASLHLVCIEHRDKFNKKVKENLQKNKLFQYVESKKANHDFKDDASDSDVDSIDDEISIMKSSSVFHPPASDSSTTAGNTEESNSWSPRSQYIDACIRKQLNPRLSLLLRKNFSKRLALQHHGIGDEMAILFSQAIENIPFIQSLNIADNNLTDKGLGPIVSAVTGMAELIDLNLSYNVIGPNAATCLSSYLSSPFCPLQRLVLRRADVDDGECERFVTSLKTNRYLTELDLSENLLGSSEQLNTVMPDITTGGEALAELLSSDGCALQTLKLGWNMIRLDSAIQLCQSLSVNKTLTYLDLSFNALGCQGGIALGSSLQDNKTLRSLLIANNAIDSMACLTICAGILQNEALRMINIDGNPIGDEGARALMLLPTMVGNRVEISAASCNITIRDGKCWFDSGNILRSFELKLNDPFHRAVAIIVIQLVAVHQSYLIAHSEWLDENGKWQNLELTEKVVVDYDSKRLDANQIKSVKSLRRVVESNDNVHKAAQLFADIDKDGSGQLDEKEFAQLLESLGYEATEEKISEIMDEYDINQGGYIELPEFLLFMRNQLKEISLKLKELTEFPIISMKAEPGLERYIPPRHGTLKLNIIDGFQQKPTYRVISDSDRKCIDLLASQSGDIVTMTAYGVQSYKIRLSEAKGIVATMLKETNNKSLIMGKVLPQVATADEARKLLSKTLKGSKTEICRIRREMGNIARPILGNPDGYYSLDLSDPTDRLCLTRLLEISKTRAHFRSAKSVLGYGVLGDCSQKGNWSNFRNEIFRGRHVTLSTEFASPMPRSGKLEFDFVSERRCQKDDLILSDARVITILIQLYQLRQDERSLTLKRLQKSKLHTDRTLHGDGRTVYECPSKRSKEISNFMAQFYDNLAARHVQIEGQKQFEKVTHYEGIDERIAEMEQDGHLNQRSAANLLRILSLKDIKDVNNIIVEIAIEEPKKSMMRKSIDPMNFSHITPKSTARGHTSRSSHVMEEHVEEEYHHFEEDDGSDADSEEAANDVLQDHLISKLIAESISSNHDNSTVVVPKEMSPKKAEKSLDDWMRRYVRVVASTNNTNHAKAAKILEVLVEAFEYSFFMARHLELMVDLFQDYGCTPTSEFFGTYRVELIVSLFGSVVDLHNFEIVLRRLTPLEAACVYCRIGWLHLYNPMKPQGAYELDLSRREERIVLKTITTLSTHEPGENFMEVNFRWERNMDPMPGFELTVPWMTEEGLPHKGLFYVYYYAGEGKGKKGCKPAIRLRKSMLHLVLIDEEEIVNELDRDKHDRQVTLVGESHLKANLSMWYGYLAYNEEEYKKLKSAKDTITTASDKKKGKK